MIRKFTKFDESPGFKKLPWWKKRRFYINKWLKSKGIYDWRDWSVIGCGSLLLIFFSLVIVGYVTFWGLILYVLYRIAERI